MISRTGNDFLGVFIAGMYAPNKVLQWSQLRSAFFMVSLRSFYHKNYSTILAH